MISLKTNSILVIATLFSASAGQAEIFHVKEPFSQTAAFSADGTVEVRNVNGNVEIRTWDRNEIRIEGEKSARTQEELERIVLTIDTSPDSARVNVELPKRSAGLLRRDNLRANVRISITVPRAANLSHVHTVNGNVLVEQVEGRVVASSVNGRVAASAVANDATLSTVNGSIDAHLASLSGRTRFQAETVNGSVTLRLPREASAAVDASTVNGRVHCDFPMEVTDRAGGRRLRGTIGTGAARIKVHTVNGGVRIQRT